MSDAFPKHGFVDATLTAGERLAPFARLAAPDPEPLDKPTRCGLDWDGDDWTEWDPATGTELARGTVKRRPQ